MDFARFNEAVSRRESDLILQGKTADGLLWIACFSRPDMGVSTLVANTLADNTNSLITDDAHPVSGLDNEIAIQKIAAMPVTYFRAAGIPSQYNKTNGTSTRNRCMISICLGQDSAVSELVGGRYTELTTREQSGKITEAKLGFTAVQLFK